MRAAALVLVLAVFFLPPAPAAAKSNIVNTKHNLSVTGPGEIKAFTEDRICIFCHTPHNATPSTPLWNKDLDATNYITYQSSTLAAVPGLPSGPSRLCLSCHDGTVALGDLRTGTVMTTLSGLSGRPSLIGTDISDDHPVSFSYYSSLPNDELYPILPQDLLFYGSGNIHCSTCHDAHDDSHGMFLRVDNSFSALCTRCHVITSWSGSSHSSAVRLWNGAGADPWPHTEWLTVAENGCENCHAPHSAGGPQRLLNVRNEEDNCYPCHNGNVAVKNVLSEFQKFSRHRVGDYTIGVTANYHDPAENPLFLSKHVECQDCHNPHASNPRAGQPPYVPGPLDQVSGVDKNGIGVDQASYEYEICFKCHADTSMVNSFVRRYINENNTRYEFDTTNPSYHPVVGVGKNLDVPSIPSTYEPQMTVTSMIYCSDCHDADDSESMGGSGPRGPHGSIYEPILKARYETRDYTPESFEAYALCYRCHDRQHIITDSSLFADRGGGHTGHVVVQKAPCGACHDPHGVRPDGLPGDHSHLINFDVGIVSPAPGESVPRFTDKGFRSGSCTLVCHGKEHTDANSSYP